VFSFLSKNEKLRVKVAEYLKTPYAHDFWDPLRMQCKPYKNVHDGLYYAKLYDRATYFYCKNDSIICERKYNYEVAMFKYDLLKGDYVPLKFSKLKGIIRDEDTFWISINDRIRFVVSRDTELEDKKRYVTVANVSDGRFLLTADKEEEIYLGLLPPLCAMILPIMQIKKDGIFIHLFDWLSESSYTMVWYLSDIKTLINTAVQKDEAPKSYRQIKEKIIYDSITAIEEFDFISLDGNMDCNSDNDSKALTLAFKIKAKGETYRYELRQLIINIELNEDRVTSILHFKNRDSELLVLEKSTKWHVVYEVESTLYSLSYVNSLARAYQLSKTSGKQVTESAVKIYRDIIYEDDCHYLIRHARGIKIHAKEAKNGKFDKYIMQSYEYNPSSIYRYKQYIFVINYLSQFKMAVIDTKSRLLVIFAPSSSRLQSLTGYKTLYYFYPIEKSDQLVFVHSSLKSMIILNIMKLNHLLDRVRAYREKRGCGGFYGHEVISTVDMEHICEICYIPELVRDGIQSVFDYNEQDTYLHIVGHYFDSQNYKLYFIAKLVQQNMEATALLVWNCLYDKVRFKLECYAYNHANNSATKVSTCNSKNLAKYYRLINNMDLCRIESSSGRFDKFGLLCLDTNRFVDVEYHRFNYRLHGWGRNLKINRIGNVILMEYKSIRLDREDDGSLDVDSSFCFVVSRMHLVACSTFES
jgi:hypothetical protein